MLKGFGNILLKELKELIRDPKIIIGMIVIPLVLFPVLGLVMGYAQQTAVEQAQKSQLLIVDNDGGNWSQTFVGYFGMVMNVTRITNVSVQQVIDQGLLKQYNVSSFLEIPNGFSANMTVHLNSDGNVTATVNSYSEFQGTSIFGGIGSTITASLVNSFNRAVAPDVVVATTSTILKGQVEQGVDPSALSGLLAVQAIALPVTIMILLTYAMQIAATSVAMEKEEKTLETLLTMPVDRFTILMGKLSSTIIVAGVAAVTILTGYNFMLNSVTSNISASAALGGAIDLARLGLVPTPLGYLLLGVSLFVTLLSALALAVIMSAFSEDVRGAQALVGYIYPIIFIPAFALLYLDINALPLALRAVFFAIPYSHPIIASKAIIVGDYTTVALGIVYVTAFTLIIMYIASRLFATEKILTAKLKFGKRGDRGKAVKDLD